ncbi:Uncharacterized conserved protein [Budvicia aquatica]|uniref:Uncharacterized conserved protein n=1 Tax=Budvicia aquatica TaxID=82979 RepID=A0A484ZUU4_9GAMM|nr:Uncharacterized conserved protein [Budvicia aquatica]
MEQLQAGLAAYEPELMVAFGRQMRAKLGMFTQDPQDNDLLNGLLDLMAKEKRDYTQTFRLLGTVEQASF